MNAYLYSVKPFTNKNQNYLEIFNEAVIFFAGFLSIAYT